MGSGLKITQVNAVVAEIYGGPSVGSVALNAKLRELGIDATLYATSLNGARKTRISEAEKARYRATGADVRLYKPSFPTKMQNSWRLCLAIFLAVSQSDLVHIHGQYHLPHVYAYMASRLFRVPYGVQPHGGLEPYQRSKSRKLKALYNWLVGSRLLQHASYIHFSSPSEAERASDVVTAQQSMIVPLGAALPAEQSIEFVREELIEVPRQKTVLFLGRLTHKKRPDLLISAWAYSSAHLEAKLIIAGPDEDITAAELKEQAERLGVSDSIVFAGQVTGPEKAWLYRNSGTFVLASENENFGLTVGEAMLGGCHVIASKDVAASSFLIDADAGQVLAEMTESSLAEALDLAIRGGGWTEESGRRAASFASANLGWSALAEALSALAASDSVSKGR